MKLFKNLKMKRTTFVLILLAVAILVLLCGCTTWKWKNNPPTYYEWNVDEQHDGGWNATHNYYVIDANADEPDAYFETKSEALTYQKDFAEHHDYVIVKIDKKYNVYSMEKPRKIFDN
jgi:hypothetical protein|tara:strand:+ start:1136 stop:1489 length:354 start_codon:yes stop_codon:yes gene_type:complete